jgi:hypothetical protein
MLLVAVRDAVIIHVGTKWGYEGPMDERPAVCDGWHVTGP